MTLETSEWIGAMDATTSGEAAAGDTARINPAAIASTPDRRPVTARCTWIMAMKLRLRLMYVIT